MLANFTITNILFFYFISFYSLFFLNTQARAQDDNSTTNGFITLLSGYAPDFEGSDDYKIIPYASIRIEKSGYYFQTEGSGGVINIIPNGSIKFGPSFNYHLPRNHSVKDSRIKNMAKISGAFEAGGFIAFETNGLLRQWDNLEVRARIMTDTSNHHSGTILEISSSYRAPINREIFVGISTTTSFADKNYRQTYFGISQSDSLTSGLNAFQVEDGFTLKDINIAFNGNYSFHDNWGLFSIISYTRFTGQVTDSPILNIVGSPNQFFFALGLSYRF